MPQSGGSLGQKEFAPPLFYVLVWAYFTYKGILALAPVPPLPAHRRSAFSSLLTPIRPYPVRGVLEAVYELGVFVSVCLIDLLLGEVSGPAQVGAFQVGIVQVSPSQVGN
jgi:hypothetical protein